MLLTAGKPRGGRENFNRMAIWYFNCVGMRQRGKMRLGSFLILSIDADENKRFELSFEEIFAHINGLYDETDLVALHYRSGREPLGKSF